MPAHRTHPPRPFTPAHRQITADYFLQPPHQTPLLLAIANDDVANAAIRVTAELAIKRGALPTVLQVVDPSPYAPSPLPSMMVLAETLIGPNASEERRHAITTRLEHACGHPVSWPVISRLGGPTACIADEAHSRHSELLVLGLHHHGKMDHLLGAETTIHVLTSAGVPVFGITSKLQTLPQRILVGVDFGHASMRVARLAARLIEPPGQLTLAHVQYETPSFVPEDLEGPEIIHHEGILAAFEKLKQEIAPAPGVVIKTVLLMGDPAQALVTYAEQMKPDVIAVASQRHARVTRLLLGSVSRHIVRDGRWSVFVTPPA